MFFPEIKTFTIYLGIMGLSLHLTIFPFCDLVDYVGWILLSLTIIHLNLHAPKGYIVLTVLFGYLLDIFVSPRVGLYLTAYLMLLWMIPKIKKRVAWQNIWGCLILSILFLLFIQIWIVTLSLFLDITHLSLVSLRGIITQGLIGAIFSPILFRFYDKIIISHAP